MTSLTNGPGLSSISYITQQFLVMARTTSLKCRDWAAPLIPNDSNKMDKPPRQRAHLYQNNIPRAFDDY